LSEAEANAADDDDDDEDSIFVLLYFESFNWSVTMSVVADDVAPSSTRSGNVRFADGCSLNNGAELVEYQNILWHNQNPIGHICYESQSCWFSLLPPILLLVLIHHRRCRSNDGRRGVCVEMRDGAFLKFKDVVFFSKLEVKF
jgi:hypothetical protein